MAAGGGRGEQEYYRLLVRDIPAGSNHAMLLKVRLQNFPGQIVNVSTQGTTNAVVTLQCPSGQSRNIPPEAKCSELGGSTLTVHYLGTEKTTTVMENLPLVVAQKFAELAPAYSVALMQIDTGIFLSGLIDNIYNLRSEVDAALLWSAKANVSNAPQPEVSVPPSASQPHSLPTGGAAGSAVGGTGVYAPIVANTSSVNPPFGRSHSLPNGDTASSSVWGTGAFIPAVSNTPSVNHVAPPPGMPAHMQPVGGTGVFTPAVSIMSPVDHVVPPPGMPAHMQPVVFKPSKHLTSSSSLPPSSPTRASETGARSTVTDEPTFDPNSPLRRPTFNPHAAPASEASTAPVRNSSHEPIPLPAGSDPMPPAAANSERFSTPPSSPPPPCHVPVSEPNGPLPVVNEEVVRTESSPTPPPSDPASTPGEETTNVFTNLHPDALALLERLPEGDIPGIQYNIREGSVRIQFQAKGDVEEAISKFQDAYKKVAGSHDRRLRVEGVHIPAARSKEEVKAQISKFEQQYKFCAFVFEEEKQQVKVISQSRQFEQAKQFLRDALQQPLASASGPTGSGSTGTYAASMVITLPSQRKLTLKKADIVKEKANMLVNAANGRLLHGGGVAGALDAASHGKLQQYSHHYMEQSRKRVEIPVGEVAVTHGGGALKCNYVIHTVGPDSTSHSQSQSEHLVKVAIRNTLKAAERYNATSIAIPALSCGIFGVSKDVVARSITDAILGFNFSKPFPILSDIRIVIIDEPTHSCFARYFEQKIRFPQGPSKRKTVPDDHSSSASGPDKNDFGLAKNDVKEVPLAGAIALNVDDLSWIMTLLGRIAPKWKAILTALGASNDRLMVLMEKSEDPTVLLNNGLSRWLKWASSKVTLATLARALRSSEVGEDHLASEIVKAGLQRKKQRAETRESPESLKYPELPSVTEDSEGAGADRKGSSGAAAPSTASAKDECPICIDDFKNPTKTKCGHMFCKDCIEKALQYDSYCPTCKKPLRPITGKQPLGGTMTHKILPYSVPGCEGCNTIQISYIIPSGVQGPEHPNPGQRYGGTSRVAYLPDNWEGREVFQLLQKAFQARMVFTVGTSVTTGAQNAVVWNDIHHKTNISGGQQGYGYPDPTYLQRVKEDLAAKGIVRSSVV